jgi:hypothetical protein
MAQLRVRVFEVEGFPAAHLLTRYHARVSIGDDKFEKAEHCGNGG